MFSKLKNALGVLSVFVGVVFVMGVDAPTLSNMQILKQGSAGVLLMYFGYKMSKFSVPTNK